MAVVKAVSFKNKEKELLSFIGDRDFSYYIKELIRKDMKGQTISKAPGKVEEPIKRRNTNYEI